MNFTQMVYYKFRKPWYLLWDLIHFLGLNKQFYGQARGCRIMLYHGLCLKEPFRFNTLFITKKRFENHLKFYKKYFHVLSLDDFYAGRFDPNRFNICLTFDDGFANNYKYVLPLLEQYEIPATFFITAISATGYDILWNDYLCLAGKYGPQNFTLENDIYYKNQSHKYYSASGISLSESLRSVGFDQKIRAIEEFQKHISLLKNKDDLDFYLQMSPQQIQALSASRFATIGSHGYYHNDLSQIWKNDAFEEMELSKKYLENISGNEVKSIAFPYGAYTREVVNDAKTIGYKQILATDFNDSEDKKDKLMRERFTINPFISTASQTYAIIKGRYE